MSQVYKHPHFVGIGGIGMSALAKWFLSEGAIVSGSDVHESDITRDLAARGASVHIGHAASNLPADADILIYSAAVPADNAERVAARERGMLERTNFEILGELSKSFSTIVVTGTNGKSTTTAMLGLILEAAGYDPTVLVGSLVPRFADGNLRLGKSRFFVVEGCEYRANMLHLEPEMIVLTNVEEDHLDYYRDLAHIQETFQRFLDKLQGRGMAVMNADDPGSKVLKVNRPVTYGLEAPRSFSEGGSNRLHSTYAITTRSIQNGVQQISTNVGDFALRVPGEFNAYNAMAALAAAMELGVPFETCRRALHEFRGIWRRFERVGVWRGADVISDYGHHPTAIRETVVAAREFFPGRRIVLCYQPHQHDRTRKLFNKFVEVLPLADVTVVTEIYDVAGRNEAHDISSRDLVEAINQSSTTFAHDLSAARSQLSDLVRPDDVLLIMGAGDIDDLARELSYVP